ncbi:MAG: hypothetical protein M3131_01015 [Actinomycetota bacterium]|nr:hypothetical protein [Actinomycetota bacterium]
MSGTPRPRASELAAEQVEQIVSAAQSAAEEIRREARLEQEGLRRSAEEDADALRKEARREAELVLEQARSEAVLLGTDARRDAEALLKDAREESARIREQSQRAVDGRVAAADKAAGDVLEEARALSAGLRQLGRSLEDHAERILREVTSAHRRMQADLRVEGTRTGEPATAKSPTAKPARPAGARFAPRDELATSRRDEASAADRDGLPGKHRGRSPLENLEVPPWVAQSR